MSLAGGEGCSDEGNEGDDEDDDDDDDDDDDEEEVGGKVDAVNVGTKVKMSLSSEYTSLTTSWSFLRRCAGNERCLHLSGSLGTLD